MGDVRGSLRVARVVAIISLVCVASLGCSSGGSGVGDRPLEGVVGNDPMGTTLPASEASPWDGPPPSAADVEAAYTEFVACLTDAGIEGQIQFDLTRSNGMFRDLVLGSTEAEISRSEASIKRCSDEFDAVMDPYMYANPETEAQRNALIQRILACADTYFPGQVDKNLSLDDLSVRYGDLTMTIEASDCYDEAWAGPRQSIGKSLG